MNTDSDHKASNNAIKVEDYAACVHEISAADTETIDFGDDIDKNSVVEFEKGSTNDASQASATPNLDQIVEQLNDAPIQHRESTHLVTEAADIVENIDKESINVALQPTKKKRNLLPFLIALCLILVICAATGYILHVSKQNTAKQQEQASSPAAVAVEKKATVERINVPVTLTPEDAKHLNFLVNGVPLSLLTGQTDSNTELPLVKNTNNMVNIFADDFTPISVNVAKNHDFTESPLEFNLQPADIYQHTKLIIRAPKNIDYTKVLVYINGAPKMAKPELQLDFISGFPVFIHISQEGLGDHLHVMWPTRSDELIELPNLKPQSDKLTSFTLNIPNDYARDRSFGMSIIADNEKMSTAGTRSIPKTSLINIDMRKNGRYPFFLTLDPAQFGSITVDAYMQLASQGIAKVKFHRKSDRDITLCFRRPSEAICATEEETIVLSGKWELAAYVEKDGRKIWFKNAPYETLSPEKTYTFSLRQKGNTFTYNIVKTEPSK